MDLVYVTVNLPKQEVLIVAANRFLGDLGLVEQVLPISNGIFFKLVKER